MGVYTDFTEALGKGMRDVSESSIPAVVRANAAAEARDVIERESREAVNSVTRDPKVTSFLRDNPEVLSDINPDSSLEAILLAIRNSGKDGAEDCAKTIEKARTSLQRRISSAIRDSPGFKASLKKLSPELQEEILGSLGGGMLRGAGNAAKDQLGSGLKALFSVDNFKKVGAAVGLFLVGRRLTQDFAAQNPDVCKDMCLKDTNTKQSENTDNGKLKNPNCKAKPANVPDCKTWCGTGPNGACSSNQCDRRGEIECGGILNALKCGVDNISDAAKSGIDLWKQYGATILRFVYITAFVIGLYLVWTFLKTFIVTVPTRKVKGWRDAAIRKAGGDAP